MPNESQISNITTASTITNHNVKVQVLSTTLPTVAVAKDKNKGSSKHNAEIHEKTFRADHGHHVQNNHTWKKFPWTKEVGFLFIAVALFQYVFLTIRGVRIMQRSSVFLIII